MRTPAAPAFPEVDEADWVDQSISVGMADAGTEEYPYTCRDDAATISSGQIAQPP